MKMKTENSKLIYTFVSGKGSPKYGKQYTSEDPLDFEFKASIRLTAAEAKQYEKIAAAFWKENKITGFKLAGTFLKEEEEITDELDDYGEKIKKPTGFYILTASTNRAFKKKDGVDETTIALYRANGKKIPATHPLVLGEVGVGENSTGIIHGKVALSKYEKNAYVKIYLQGIQFTNFIPRELEGAIDTEEIIVEDDGFDSDGLDEVAPANEAPNI